ncbi:unnamed protein product [Gulo gulo]|uniref:Uncharacterized protein n=1 Tax=Gulo gulo TaxID=48420 RepID=A0A9X9MCC3_GULGU|nr:unnamed protein product [Gulo gulo]
MYIFIFSFSWGYRECFLWSLFPQFCGLIIFYYFPINARLRNEVGGRKTAHKRKREDAKNNKKLKRGRPGGSVS